MPPGVAPAVVLEPVNAALYAAKILGLSDTGVAEQVRKFQATQRDRVMQADQEMQK
jgi:phosphoribosylcarboxyaminoimidazole (NCAIR) mutase